MAWRQSFWPALLRRGVKQWNEWRAANQVVSPSFVERDFAGIYDVSGFDFTSAYLAELDLRKRNFNGADLSGANLTGANLTRASFRGAKLIGTRLRFANLTEADFERSDFQFAELEDAIFSSTNLKWVQNLGHTGFGRSTFDLSTLRVSGPLPSWFLRARGVPDLVIENRDALFEHAIVFNTCFISYSTSDSDFASTLDNILRERHVRTWFAPKDMKIGDRVRQVIDGAIRMRQKLIVILSVHSVKSAWVESEVETALEEERRRNAPVLFPVRIDDAVFEADAAWAAEVRRRHIGNFSQWRIGDEFKSSCERLFRDLKTAHNDTPAT